MSESEELYRDDIEKMAREINEIERSLLLKITHFSRDEIVVAKSGLSLAKTVIEKVLEEKPFYNALDIKELEELQEFISNSLCCIGCKIIIYKKENLRQLVDNFNNKGFNRS